jgi:DNA-binding CsgD family transcriptional regulator
MVVAVDGQEHIVHVAELGYASTPVFVSIVAPRHSFLRSDAELRKSYGLSPRQIQVAHMLAERCSNKEIASRLRISVHTVSSHVRITMLKLGVCRRSDVRDLIRGRHPPAISV